MTDRPVLLLRKARPKVPTLISGHVRADGTEVQPHVALRGGAEAPEAQGETPLEAFIARHGGPERFRAALDAMTPEQRAKLVEAMGHIGGKGADVMGRLGMTKPAPEPTPHAAEAPPAEQPAGAAEPGVDLGGIHDDLSAMGDADDREDLADAMVRDPHSDESTSLLKRIAKRLFRS